MYLAGILVLCALLHAESASKASSGHLSSDASRNLKAGTIVGAQPALQDPDSSEAASQDQRTPEPAQPRPQVPSDTAPKPTPAQAPNAKPPHPKASTRAKPPATASQDPRPKNHTVADKDNSKTVIHRGSTAEPAMQLSPGITPQQAARQRESTNQLLASTDAALRKISGRLLSRDERNTVDQIRKFMEQSKTADAAGDLQRSYKLALKAHLLSDELAKP